MRGELIFCGKKLYGHLGFHIQRSKRACSKQELSQMIPCVAGESFAPAGTSAVGTSARVSISLAEAKERMGPIVGTEQRALSLRFYLLKIIMSTCNGSPYRIDCQDLQRG